MLGKDHQFENWVNVTKILGSLLVLRKLGHQFEN